MTADQPTPDEAGELRPRQPRRRVSVIGVIGEILITAGVVVLLFIAWQLWWNDWITGNSQSAAATEQSQKWIEQARNTPAPTAGPTQDPKTDPPVMAADSVVDGTPFAVFWVPRFGDGFHRNITEGTGTNVLNDAKFGVGHYTGTQLPGEVGNFAIASHRTAYGGGLHLIDEFQPGDPIIVQTQDGWYTYRFRNMQYVKASQVEVIAQVPGVPDAAPTDRIMTMTTCNPLYSSAERIAAYAVFDDFRSNADGPPPEIAAAVAAQSNGG